MGAKKRSDRWLWGLGLLGLLMYFVFSWQDLFAAQEWKALSREEVVEKAKANWQEAGIELEGYRINAVMESEPSLDGYLGKEDLRSEFENQAPATAPSVYWHVTFYAGEMSSGDTRYETYHDLVSGQVFRHIRPDTDDGKEIGETEALQLAQSALSKLGIDRTRLSLLTDEELMLEEVGDWELNSFHFVWEDHQYAVGESRLYYSVNVTDGNVSAVTSYYEVPEAFEQWQSKQTLFASILTGFSMLGSFLMLVIAFVFLFLLQQKRPHWTTLWLSLLVMVLYAASNINQWPIIEAQGLAEGGVLGVLIVGAFAIVAVVFVSILVGAGNYPLTMTGAMLVREVKPSLWLSRKDPEWGERLRLAAKRGYLLAFAWMGFQGLFYFIGERYFGVWYENDLSMSPANMWVPALFPLMAWFAGISEEIVYRLFGVTFLKRYLKYSFVATLLPAMIWALGHSLYPIYPIYTRFIELTIFGVIIGYCYLHYGLETVIFAHVIFDTVLMCIPLFLSGEAVQVASGIGFLILPLLVGYGFSLIKPKREQLDFA
ncbi:CPBP family intramembrane glutamic endopeptidase [Tumebacillus algifaecis]|uniref:CPBP family intramembrane glutamic endopeptidase n=1 Tax=Tumebacillus algifaecis TaxID=1214604 RepID=UPI0012FDC120|nr:type II CAAX endopeptidase family protein [Tumebacillus algifaecis]